MAESKRVKGWVVLLLVAAFVGAVGWIIVSSAH
jgi:uncharacterized membrane protein